jgi:hypothetical protein
MVVVIVEVVADCGRDRTIRHFTALFCTATFDAVDGDIGRLRRLQLGQVQWCRS